MEGMREKNIFRNGIFARLRWVDLLIDIGIPIFRDCYMTLKCSERLHSTITCHSCPVRFIWVHAFVRNIFGYHWYIWVDTGYFKIIELVLDQYSLETGCTDLFAILLLMKEEADDSKYLTNPQKCFVQHTAAHQHGNVSIADEHLVFILFVSFVWQCSVL